MPVSGAYGFVAGSDLDLGEVVSEAVAPGTGAILTDSTVGPLYAAAVKHHLESTGWRVANVIEVPPGKVPRASKLTPRSSGGSRAQVWAATVPCSPSAAGSSATSAGLSLQLTCGA